MNTPKQAVKRELKVYVKMHDGTRMLGVFYLLDTERLQDVMNDARSFLPLYVFDEKSKRRHTIMLAKRYIEQVEEFDTVVAKNEPLTPSPSEPAVAEPFDRRVMDLSKLSLDDAHFTLKRSSDKP